MQHHCGSNFLDRFDKFRQTQNEYTLKFYGHMVVFSPQFPEPVQKAFKAVMDGFQQVLKCIAQQLTEVSTSLDENEKSLDKKRNMAKQLKV